MDYKTAMQLAPQQAYHSGPPPEGGYWMTRFPVPGRPGNYKYAVRWYDGDWSVLLTQADAALEKLNSYVEVGTLNHPIEWCERFWERAQEASQ